MQMTSFNFDQVLELGIFAKTFRRSSVGGVFDAIAGHGLTCAQWNWACVPGFPSQPEAVPAEVTRTVARAAASSGVRICAVSATFNLIDPASLITGLLRLPVLAKAALAIECDLLTLCTGTRHATDMWAHHPENRSNEAWTDMIEGLRLMQRTAAQYGVRLAIEPETANVVCDAKSAQLALQQLGSEAAPVSIILDAANLYGPPADPCVDYGIIEDAIERLGDRISLAHAKDIADPYGTTPSGYETGHYTHVAAGTGVLNYPFYVAALARSPAACALARDGKRMPLVIHGLAEDEVQDSIAFLREIIGAAKPEQDTKLEQGASVNAVLSQP